MNATDAIAARLARLQRAAVALTTLLAVLAGTAVGAATSLHREDQVTLGAARLLPAS